MSLTPDPERAPGEGNGNPLQYSCLGNPMDRGAWQVTAHGAHMGSQRVGHNRVTTFSLYRMAGLRWWLSDNLPAMQKT